MIDIFGTLGPGCRDKDILSGMFAEGMTGIRINLSHVMLSDCKEDIEVIQEAARENGCTPKILIDMQGPELRIGDIKEPITLREKENVIIGDSRIPLEERITRELEVGMEVLLDDGKILAVVKECEDRKALLTVKRGGILTGRKSIALVGKNVTSPAVTEVDEINIANAKDLGITGIMQPFVRSREDILALKEVMAKHGCSHLRIYAKIENTDGLNGLESFINDCDEVIIARGDLGNSMPLWELPRAQKHISKICVKHNKPFMVVTQMLSSMEHKKIPTRAEVNDIYNAVLDGATSVMVTGETAVGEYPVEVIKYLAKTAGSAVKTMIL